MRARNGRHPCLYPSRRLCDPSRGTALDRGLAIVERRMSHTSREEIRAPIHRITFTAIELPIAL